jgi:hypothetical protein
MPLCTVLLLIFLTCRGQCLLTLRYTSNQSLLLPHPDITLGASWCRECFLSLRLPPPFAPQMLPASRAFHRFASVHFRRPPTPRHASPPWSRIPTPTVGFASSYSLCSSAMTTTSTTMTTLFYTPPLSPSVSSMSMLSSLRLPLPPRLESMLPPCLLRIVPLFKLLPPLLLWGNLTKMTQLESVSKLSLT